MFCCKIENINTLIVRYVFNYLGDNITECSRNSVPELVYVRSLQRDQIFCAKCLVLATTILAKV
jgi:hypothetical protein